MPISEVGHARNVQFFEQMISYVTAYGAAYAPSNLDIALAKLLLKHTSANTAMDQVQNKVAAFQAATNSRETAFKPLRPLVTRAVNYYASTGAEDNSIEDARSFKRKIDGRRAPGSTPLDPVVPPTPPGPGDPPPPVTHSSSQQSYTQLVEHVDGLIELFSSDSLYDPNEDDIKVTNLTIMSALLKASNSGVIAATTDISNARINRTTVMYDPDTGMVELALMVKKYVLALFGASSPQYKQVSKLRFRNEPA